MPGPAAPVALSEAWALLFPEAAAAAALPGAGPAFLLVAVILGLLVAFGSGKTEDEVSGEEIRDLRKRKNLTQEELASVLGVGVATIRRWESGGVKPQGNNLALVRQLMATPDLPSPVQLQKESLSPWDDMLRNLLADGRVKRILASRILSVDLAGADPQQSPFPQILTLLQSGNPLGQMDPALPFPKSPEERAALRQEELKGMVDVALLERFYEEQQARGLTASKMLETILWKYFGYPALSYQPNGADGPLDDPSHLIEQGADEKGGSQPVNQSGNSSVEGEIDAE